jgi:hypothetical protein
LAALTEESDDPIAALAVEEEAPLLLAYADEVEGTPAVSGSIDSPSIDPDTPMALAVEEETLPSIADRAAATYPTDRASTAAKQHKTAEIDPATRQVQQDAAANPVTHVPTVEQWADPETPAARTSIDAAFFVELVVLAWIKAGGCAPDP